jgi:hypothetical protein
MDDIHQANDKFDFQQLELSTPILVQGNYFIRFMMNQKPNVYIQPATCMTKQGIVKAGKKSYTDLMFTNEHLQFIRWLEHLEEHCRKAIYEHREQWFEGSMEMHDIENYFTSPIKIFKSGKYYLVRTNISTVLGKPTLKIYDENEEEVDFETIREDTNIVCILEFQGIKCSARSFQIEIELKQAMIVRPQNTFEKCIIKPLTANTKQVEEEKQTITEAPIEIKEPEVISPPDETIEQIPTPSSDEMNIEKNMEEVTVAIDLEKAKVIDPMEIQEIDVTLDQISDSEPMQIRKRNEVYYEMYREARRKARIARDLALSSYLEAKRIKNTYMLDDIKDSDDSDLEGEEEETGSS